MKLKPDSAYSTENSIFVFLCVMLLLVKFNIAYLQFKPYFGVLKIVSKEGLNY